MNKKVNLKSILILDDDQEVRALLKSLLAKHFSDVNIHEYDPIQRGEPENGFDWSMFDVLILDHYLCIHGLTGLDLFQKHQKSPDFPPTIMVTAAGNEALAIRALKTGIKEYIRKEDLNAANLSEAINKAYEEHHVNQNVQQELEAAEKQIQEDRSKLETDADVVNSQLQEIEEGKRIQQEATNEVQRLKSEAEKQIQKEYAELKKEVAVVKEKLLNAVKGYSKIKKEKDGLLKDRAIFEVERQKHATEMVMAKEKIKDVNRALVATQTKQKVFEEKKQEIITKDKQPDKDKIKKDVTASNEVSGDEEVLNLTRSKAPLDADELLDPGQQTEEQGDSEVTGKTEEIETVDEVLDITKAANVDELLDPGQQTPEQSDSGVNEKLEELEMSDEVLDITRATTDADELLDSGQQPQEKSDSEVIDKPVEFDLHDQTINISQLKEKMDLDAPLILEEESQEQSGSKVIDAGEPDETDQNDQTINMNHLGTKMDLDAPLVLEEEPQEQSDAAIDADELLDPGQKSDQNSDKPDNGQS